MNKKELAIEHVALDAVARHLDRLSVKDRRSDLEYLYSRVSFCPECCRDYLPANARGCFCQIEED